MAETQTKPEVDQIPDDPQSVPSPKTKVTNLEDKVKEKTPEETLDEEIAVFEPVEKAVDRTLAFNGETKVYVQHEMGFMTKLKFFRSLSKAIKAATDQGGANFLNELFSPGDLQDADGMVQGLLSLIEVVPEFIEEAYCYALSIPPREQDWAIFAFDNLDDDEGLDILDVFIAQNGESVSNFFTEKLPKLGKRVQAIMPQADQSQDQ